MEETIAKDNSVGCLRCSFCCQLTIQWLNNFGTRFSRQVVVIPLGTDCASLPANLSLLLWKWIFGHYGKRWPEKTFQVIQFTLSTHRWYDCSQQQEPWDYVRKYTPPMYLTNPGGGHLNVTWRGRAQFLRISTTRLGKKFAFWYPVSEFLDYKTMGEQ